MNRLFLIISMILATWTSGLATEPVRFSVRVSTDSVLMGNPFQVQFTLENAEGRNFSAPSFSPDFMVVSGPNTSTSISMMNGQTSRSMTYTYILEPIGEGNFFIGPASVETEEGYLETSPIEIMVVPNPDGIRQPLNDRLSMQEYRFGSPDDFFGGDLFQQFQQQFEEFMQPYGGDSFRGFPAPDSLGMDPFQDFGFDMEQFMMPFGKNFNQQMPDSLNGMPLDQFFQQEFDMEELQKMFPGMPDDFLQRFLPEGEQKKKKRKTWKM